MTDQESIALRALVTLARVVDQAFDDSEEFQSDRERGHWICGQDFDDVCEQLDALAGLPDDKPGQTLGPAGKAEWALRRLMLEADHVEAFGPTEPPAQPEAPTRDLLTEARDQVAALDRENHQMRRCVARLMARLTVWLDDDQFNEADGILHPEFEPPAQQPDDWYSADKAFLEQQQPAQQSPSEAARLLRSILTDKDMARFMCDEDFDALRTAITALETPAQQPMTDAARDVFAERQRQIEVEGWTPEHDDEHDDNAIAVMACFYAMPPGVRNWCAESTGYGATLGEAILPEGWDAKTGDRRRELVKAAALLVAEIERLDRQGGSE